MPFAGGDLINSALPRLDAEIIGQTQWGDFPSPDYRQPVPAAGTLKNLSVYVYENTANGATTITLLVNGSGVGVALNFAAGETGKKKEVFDAPVTDGAEPDVVSFRARCGGDSGVVRGNISSLFVPTA